MLKGGDYNNNNNNEQLQKISKYIYSTDVGTDAYGHIEFFCINMKKNDIRN